MRRSPRLIILLILPLFLLLGCGDDDDNLVSAGDQPESYPVADSPDQLVANFTQAWNERNTTENDLLLHEDYQFYFSMEDVDLPAAAGGVWARVRELSCTQNMFTGKAGVDEYGGLQAPVQRIQLLLTPLMGVWSDQVPEERAGTVWREYNVEMQIDYTDGNGASVRGLQRFYAAPVADGEDTVYQLKFWEELGRVGRLSNDQSSWGSVKAQY